MPEINNKPIPGFESARDLIGYCELHCETPRAAFSGSQIKWMHELAGKPTPDIRDDSFISMHEDMKELCKLAREKLKEK